MSNEIQKISELNPATTLTENTLLPVVSEQTETNNTDISTLRSVLLFDKAFNSIAEGADGTEKGESYFVYTDVTKTAVQGYVNQGGGSYTPLVDINGVAVRYISGQTLRGLDYFTNGVDSFAKLRTLSPLYAGQRVKLKSWVAGGKTGGGEFIAGIGSATDDGGTIAAGNGFYWERVLSEPVIYPEFFGAVPGGTDSLSAIQQALKVAAGKYPVSFCKSTYSISGPIYIPSNSVLNGNGATLKTLTPIDTTWMQGAIFAPGNYHPEYVSNVPKNNLTSTYGSNVVGIDPSLVSKYKTGDLVRISSVRGILNGGFLIPFYMKLCKVIGVSGSNITLDIPVDYTGSDLTIMQANQPAYNARFNQPLFVCENAIVQDFVVDTWDHWTGDSATFNCVFRNISGKARAVVYGNTFCRTRFDNINITFRGRISELAFGSHDTRITNLTAIADTTLNANAMITWAESGDNCHIDGFTLVFNNTAAPSVICRFSSFTNSSIRNGMIFGVTNSNNILSFESYGGDRVPCSNNLFENITINYVTKTAVICDTYHSAADSLVTNCQFKNINYIGIKPDVAILRTMTSAGISNPIKGLKAIISSVNGGAFVANDSIEGLIDLTGPITISSLAAIATKNRVKLINSSRFTFHGNDNVIENSVSITDSTPGSVYKVINYPVGSIRLNDEITFKLEGSTAGNLGAKTIGIGFLDNTSPTRVLVGPSLTQAAGGSIFNIEGSISIIGGFAVITAVLNDNGTIKPFRAIGNIDPITSADFTLNVILRNNAAGDTINLQRLTIRNIDLTW